MRATAIAIAIVLAVAAPAGAVPADRIDRAADRVLDERYQDVPGPRAAERTATDRTRRERTAPVRRSDTEWRAGGPGAALSTIVQWLVWGGLAIAAALLIAYLVRELARGRRARRPDAARPGAVEEAVAPEAALERPLDDADRLAGEGRFAEAIHVLLLRTFEELARAASVRIAPAWTSREVLGRIGLPPAAREALVELVRVVELTWFGDDVPAEADWRRCRDAFDVFVAAYRAPARREAA